ncbi:Multiple RNA-binding domain-containing protein 1 [Ophidiomyces ophidiicola]|nr:Multiple RNA-binding domain-containing protein 1 [Ophidiomyces ophidiicola]KAI2000478.1 Multiple RNA-binding domain-containing protein 1 [Ophidiomyces ophidiicola]KAI2013984.1 Multiple RNA-binding domain-containing protein 1 [Ophidiomyces ophidiicola]KAI2027115.1 Multiple RNA-binding domain-containing protein 1 [Ophidiomyces ophidiicola]KAI2039913.1 Multiple RNA-binding domain-containing protein 1 [Ophidiomyces ophidiicola]
MESTRVFVSGLPPTLDNNGLRSHFAGRFEVTDAHIVPSRRIGFVGFKDHNSAQEAAKYFNKTFIRMSKIAVEMARPVDSTSDIKPWSKSRNSVFDKDGSDPKSTSLKRKRPTEDEDPKLREFLNTMQASTMKKTWADNGADLHTSMHSRVEESRATDASETLSSKRPKAEVEASRSDAHQCGTFRDATDVNSEPEKRPPDAKSQTDLRDLDITPQNDADWLRSKTSRLLGLVDEEEEEVIRPKLQHTEPGNMESTLESMTEPDIIEHTAQEPDEIQNGVPDANIDSIRETGRLFIRNLPYNTTEGDLERLFMTFGKLEELHVAFDTRHSTSKGFAYAQFFDPDSAIAAYQQLDGKDFQGRLMHILPASTKKTYKTNEFELSKLPLKKQQQIKRKSEASTTAFSWNSLYMNADAVMASVAERLGVPKSAILDPTSSDAAVKQAHAETHVIQETKAYFNANGVNLDSFKQRERGNTAILVKNFSFGVKVEDLKKLFDPYGQIIRLLMPPTGTIAIVEFSMPDECQKAFKGLAYRKLGDSILFLEKAPKNLFEGKSIANVSVQPQKAIGPGFSTSETFKADEQETGMESSTIYIRNLNFSTTTASLTDLFKPLDGFLSAQVKTKPDPKKPGERLSMGFGFVEFRTKAQANTALASMNGYKLDQHELVLKPSHKGMDAAEQQRREYIAKKNAARRTKIIVKNLPFQATKKDIQSLFGAYGQLRSVRVPKKFDRTARGFAFADFVSAREAENAMDALRNTHLLGRKLVLEFASEETVDAEEEIQKIEKKMDAQANRVKLKQLVGTGRKKFHVNPVDEDE